jgi:branched-chain amino acid transport system permease protein
MRSEIRSPSVACVALAILALAACARIDDGAQSRLCRMLIEPLNAPDTQVTIIRTGPTAEPNTLRLDYRVITPERAQTRMLICRFAGRGLQNGAEEMIGAQTERGPVPGSSFFLLKRFLLNSPAAQLDQDRSERLSGLPEVPFSVALAVQHGLGALPQASVYALVAAAYAMIYGLIGRIVLGFGALATIGGYATVLALAFLLQFGVTSPVVGLTAALCLALLAAAAHGVAASRLVIEPLLKRGGVTILIATAGLMIALDEYVRLAQGNAFRWMPPLFSAPIALMRSGEFVTTLSPIVPIVTALAVSCVTGLVAVMRSSAFGRAWRALADDPKAAELFGVDPRRVFLQSFLISAGLAGVAGFITTAHYGGVGFAGGFTIGLKALIGAVLGGIGSVGGAMLGGALIGLIDAGWAAVMPIDTREIALYALLSIILALRPGGLFGYGEGTPRQI